MKFLLMSAGLKGATSKFSCIYCKANLKERLSQADGSRMRASTDKVRLLLCSVYFLFSKFAASPLT